MIVFLLLNVTPQSDDFLLVLPITSFTVVGGHSCVRADSLGAHRECSTGALQPEE